MSETTAAGEPAITIEERTAQHPCFAAHCTGKNARIHLAVAPRCNIQCNYCLRKMDCVNETRPGVTSKVLSPEQAIARYDDAAERLDNLTVVGIAGPGDALANWEQTRETYAGIRARDPEVTFCLSTNGLQLPRYVDELAELSVTHLTVTLNAVDPEVGAKLYRFVEWDGERLTGRAAAERLLTNQLEGIRRAVDLGICVKINTVLVAGINVEHAVEVARVAAGLGVSYQNITCMIPVPGSAFEHLPVVDEATHARVRKECSAYLPQIYHCRQCRADAVGKLGQDLSALFDKLAAERAAKEAATAAETPKATVQAAPHAEAPMAEAVAASDTKPDESHPRTLRLAVATRSTTHVDEHFGHATSFYIYDTDGDDVRLVEERPVARFCEGPATCGRPDLDRNLAGALAAVADCDAVLALKVGPAPRHELARAGVRVIETYDFIEDAAIDAYDAIVPQDED